MTNGEVMELHELIAKLEDRSRRDLKKYQYEEHKEELTDLIGAEMDYGVTMVPSSVVLPHLVKAAEFQDDYGDGFSDGVILALQVLTSAGDGGGVSYKELLESSDKEKVTARAKNQNMLELSGLEKYLSERDE